MEAEPTENPKQEEEVLSDEEMADQSEAMTSGEDDGAGEGSGDGAGDGDGDTATGPASRFGIDIGARRTEL